jgi:indole-3-glycerol phosphate synthase
MNDILAKILDHKRREVAVSRKQLPLTELEKVFYPPTRDFKGSLRKGGLSVIAEVKQKSPSAGIICEDFDPIRISAMYQQAGADAVSVLTDTEFFGGSLAYLEKIRETVELPLLQKDFIIDPYQIFQSRAAGADAILLIVRALDAVQLADFIQTAAGLNLASLVEAHREEEVETALRAGSEMIGINNRNLATFTVDLGISLWLKKLIPESVVTVSESGIKTGEDTEMLRSAGFDAVLVGESLMRGTDLKRSIQNLKMGSNSACSDSESRGMKTDEPVQAERTGPIRNEERI